jgi:site-specific recombinase XerD
MIEGMTIRKFAPRTQEGYIRAVKGLSAFFGAPPDRASFEDLQRYQLHLVASGAGAPTINHIVTALRFFFAVTLRKPQVVVRLPFIRQPRKLLIVLSPEEVARLLQTMSTKTSAVRRRASSIGSDSPRHAELQSEAAKPSGATGAAISTRECTAAAERAG